MIPTNILNMFIVIFVSIVPRLIESVSSCNCESTMNLQRTPFSEKVAFITGSTTAIGQQIAYDLANKGAKLVLHGRNGSLIEEIIQTCQKLSPTRQTPLRFTLDMTSVNNLEYMVAETLRYYGKIDYLISAESFYRKHSIGDDIKKVSINYDLIMSNNLKPFLILSNLIAPHLERTYGSIIAITSASALKLPNTDDRDYSLSKTAIMEAIRFLANELGPKNIRVNCVAAGWDLNSIYETNQPDTILRQWINKEEMKTPLRKRLVNRKQISKVVQFLAGDDSKAINGVCIPVDGGWSNMSN